MKLYFVTECLTIRDALVIETQRILYRIIIESNSQLVVNAIQDKISDPKEIINLLDDIKGSFIIKDVSINYCNRVCNRDADRMTRNVECVRIVHRMHLWLFN